MDKNKYKNLVSKHTPKENIFSNTIVAFLIGGLMGIIGQGLMDLYSYWFNIATGDAAILMIITLIVIGCLFTALGFFDKMVNFAKCGLIIPITGFAHSMSSAALEYRKEGLVTGIGANMFKLAGTVIAYGVIGAYLFGVLRLLLEGVIT